MLELRVRASSALRCSYCHDTLLVTAFNGCPRCGTRLHGGCWKEAGLCPTLGCAPPTARRKLIVSLERPETEWRIMGVHVDSASSGLFGSLLCVAAAHAVPCFAQMFSELGVWLPASSEFVAGVPGWLWWVLSVLSVVGMSLKDRWFERSYRRGLNNLYVLLVVCAALGIIASLFAPLTYVRCGPL